MFEHRVFKTKLWHAGAALFYLFIGIKTIELIIEVFSEKPSTPRVEKNLLCKTTTLKEVDSPDTKIMATLTMTNCGGTANFESGITILNRENGKTYRGLFNLAGRPDGLNLQWKNDYTLELSGFAIENVRWLRQDNFSGATLVLRP